MPIANGTETKQKAFRSLEPQTDTVAVNVATMGADGTIGKIDPLLLPISTATQDALDLKLDASAYNDRFLGVYPTEAALISAHPTANAGDYAQVNAVGATDVVNYNWDAEENIWVIGGSGGGAVNTDALPEGSTNLYFTTARVLATLLSGISFATGGAIVSTDSILIAFGKIQKQITDNIASIALKQDALVSGTNIKTVNGTTLLGSGNLNTPDMDTTTTQTVSGVKTFLDGKFGFRNVASTFTSFFTNVNTAARTYTFQNRNGTIADDTDLALKQIKDDQVEISANSNVLNAWHGQTILFTANCTITVPASLNSSLMFPFRTLSGVTVTWAITSPHVWETTPTPTPEKTVGHFMKRGATNTIMLDV